MRNPFTYRIVRVVFYFLLMIPFVWMVTQSDQTAAQNDEGLVYVVDVHETVEKGLYRYMSRGFTEAEEALADHIILDMNTPGGAVDAAADIGDLLQGTDIPITAFVNSNATSAGAYIALNADNIVMTPNGSMGAATVVNLEGESAGDAKVTAFWISKMTGAAEANNRDPLYAEAMVDPTIEIEGLTPDNQPLDFNVSQALEYGYAEAQVNNMSDVLAFLELENATIVEVDIAFSERIARFITHPVVASILLSLASLGLILELYSPGFGFPGAIGLASLLLFFFGHMVAGFAGLEAILLFVAGVVLIAIEVFVPGFGIFGLLGLAAVVGGVVIASESVIIGLQNIGIAMVLSIVFALFLTRYMTKRGLWTKLVLYDEVGTTEGNEIFQQRSTLIGKTGRTVTQLRPSGTAIIDGKRYDVVSNGGYVEIDVPVEVHIVEGPRIVVKPIDIEE